MEDRPPSKIEGRKFKTFLNTSHVTIKKYFSNFMATGRFAHDRRCGIQGCGLRGGGGRSK